MRVSPMHSRKVAPSRIFFDLVFHGPTTAREDAAFATAIRNSGRVHLGIRTRSGTDSGVNIDAGPMPLLAQSRDAR